MPGHIKKSEGPDPDPDPWLVVGDELKIKLKSKPYDPKKSCWVPDKASGGYDEGLIDSTDGEKVTVTILESKVVSFIHVMITSYGYQLLRICGKFYDINKFHFSKKFSRRIRSAKLTHPSLTVAMICPA